MISTRKDQSTIKPVSLLLLVLLLILPASSLATSEVPILRGWGGVRLSEVDQYYDENFDSRNSPPSEVFAKEVASNAEMAFKYAKKRGYNAIRTIFRDPLFEPDQYEANPKWWWSAPNFEKMVAIAKYYDFWLIVDYHGGKGFDSLKDPANRKRWVEWWRDNIIKPYKGIYPKMVWEPFNEPDYGPSKGATKEEALEVNRLAYQSWVDMCRAQGDTLWLVHHNPLGLNMFEWPRINDPLNKIFLNKHAYYYYFMWGEKRDKWTIQDAQAQADWFTSRIKEAMRTYNKPFLGTEFGASVGKWKATPPDYEERLDSSRVTRAFVARIVEKLKAMNSGYMLWTAGDWRMSNLTGKPKPKLYGDMDTWGELMPAP